MKMKRARPGLGLEIDTCRRIVLWSIRTACCLALVSAICSGLSSRALAETRLALVIGNSEYKIGRLANPKNDARLMTTTLRKLGFQVTERLDATQKAMKRAVSDFIEQVAASGRDSVALFYYAGHGIQVGGRNYLIPVDAEIDSEADVDIESVEANVVMRSLEFSNARLSFVILDACRNNPFARSFRSAGSGLAQMDAPRGSLVAYATSPGDVAADGATGNSPYTAALASAMWSGLPVERMFREVRNEVMANTGDKQVPWESSSLIGGDFFFKPPKDGKDPLGPDIALWRQIKDSQRADDYQKYIKSYPSGTFVDVAKSRYIELSKRPKAGAATPPSTSGPAPALPRPGQAGKTFKDCAVCPIMVSLRGGRFEMGDGAGTEAETPIHPVTVEGGLAIGKYEVTFAEYTECANEDACSHRPSDSGWGRGQRPVISVNWHDAREYTRWLSDKTGRRYDIPSEAQWEYAARAGSSGMRFWGDPPRAACKFANVHDEKSKVANDISGGHHRCSDGFAKTAPVGTFAANNFGLHDILGNAWEWVFDCWHSTYENAPGDGSAWLRGGDCSKRIIRGGAWLSDPWTARSSFRSKLNGRRRLNSVGFRVIRYPD